MNNGYIEIMLPNHPNSRSNGTILEHRLIAEKKIGRILKEEEVVHHLDGNKTNNNLENLIVFKTTSDHSRFHKTGIMEKIEEGVYICPIQDSDIVECINCKKFFTKLKNKRKNKFCSIDCYKEYKNNEFIKKGNPSKEELEILIKNNSFLKIGEIYNVSDNSIRKWCKKYNILYKYKDINKNNIKKEKRFLLDDYKIKITNNNINKIFNNKDEAIIFIKENFSKNTNERNIQTSITNAIKNNKLYFGYKWEVIKI